MADRLAVMDQGVIRQIDTPEKAKRVIELGAYSVVVGSIITRPQLITKTFADALADREQAEAVS